MISAMHSDGFAPAVTSAPNFLMHDLSDSSTLYSSSLLRVSAVTLLIRSPIRVYTSSNPASDARAAASSVMPPLRISSTGYSDLYLQ